VVGSRRSKAAEAEKELRRIQAEEQRLLEAYRTEIISPAQLGAELEKLKARRNAADSRRAESESNGPAVPAGQIKKSVEDYCQEARRNLRSLALEELRELLRTIIRSIIFEGSQVRIQGHIPPNTADPTQGKGRFIHTVELRSRRLEGRLRPGHLHK
jgi:hypothetical protein